MTAAPAPPVMTYYEHSLNVPRYLMTSEWINATHILLAGGLTKPFGSYYTSTVTATVEIFSEAEGFRELPEMPQADRRFCLVTVSKDKVLKIGGY